MACAKYREAFRATLGKTAGKWRVRGDLWMFGLFHLNSQNNSLYQCAAKTLGSIPERYLTSYSDTPVARVSLLTVNLPRATICLKNLEDTLFRVCIKLRYCNYSKSELIPHSLAANNCQSSSGWTWWATFGHQKRVGKKKLSLVILSLYYFLRCDCALIECRFRSAYALPLSLCRMLVVKLSYAALQISNRSFPKLQHASRLLWVRFSSFRKLKRLPQCER